MSEYKSKQSLRKKAMGLPRIAAISGMLGALSAGCFMPLTASAYSSHVGAKHTASRKFVLGVSMYTLTNPYFAAMAQSFEKNGAKLGLTVHVDSANGDQETQLSQIETFIQQHVSAVAIAPQNSVSIVTAVEALNKAHIPVFFVDSNADPKIMALDKAKEVEVVQSNNFLGGEIIGKELVQSLGKQPKAYVGIVNFPEAESCRLRDAGFLSVIRKYPGIHVVSTLDGKASPLQGLSVATEMITGHPQMNVIFSDNGPDSQGIVQGIRSEGKTGKISLYGFSSSRQNILYIKQNSIFKAGAQQMPVEEAKIEVGNVWKYLHGGHVPQQVLAPVPGVAKSNINAALARSFG